MIEYYKIYDKMNLLRKRISCVMCIDH